ncbi:MAG: translation initiation factor IF-2 subunit beta [Candidatus Aenigmarchaeota archaeon]|nr:translation initiation factor IF-2 subunit beta [Candidatus Aenigmarchaeota archaeon]
MDNYETLLERARQKLPQLSREEKRFEIPVADVQTGKQTVVKNFAEIAKALRREPKHLAKFLFKELAVPGSLKEGALLFQGKVYPVLINQRVQEYAKRFVMCNECGKPDTTVQEGKNIIFIKCEACGARRSMETI